MSEERCEFCGRDPYHYVDVGGWLEPVAIVCCDEGIIEHQKVSARAKRVEKDPEGGWIARDQEGREIGGDGFRWNSRSAARCAVDETDMLVGQSPKKGIDRRVGP